MGFPYGTYGGQAYNKITKRTLVDDENVHECVQEPGSVRGVSRRLPGMVLLEIPF